MNGSEYSFLMKLFHRMTLGSRIISEISFDIEKNIFEKRNVSSIAERNHLFVSGLARSGTTILMNYLFQTNKFASLTYADMPLLLAPNLWSKVRGETKHSKLTERAHQDGIYINQESPEAFDEVFWKTFSNTKYILNDRLLINNLSNEVLKQYAKYIDLILIKNYHGKKLRYLSKNNNTVLRLDAISEIFPDATIIIPFRDPLQHAISLQNQHHHFCKIHEKDRFSLDYMNWIGHYEFGLNQKPFYLNNEELFAQLLSHTKEDINYWLLSWQNYYSYILDHISNHCILFHYETFCENPNKVLGQLFHQIGLPNEPFELKQFELKFRSCASADKEILHNCMEIYTKLITLSNG